MPPAEHDESASRFGVLALSAFGLGLVPLLPGTVASLATVAVLWTVSATGPGALFAACVLLAFAASWATLRFGGTVSGPEGKGDPGWVVSDEVAGQALACLLAWPPLLASGRPGWTVMGAAFVLFRVFDMAKPPPVRGFERLPGARGILMDDVAAGVIAGLITLVLAQAGVLT